MFFCEKKIICSRLQEFQSVILKVISDFLFIFTDFFFASVAIIGQDVDIKKMQAGITTYAFVQFIDINSATLAKRKMDRQAVGNNRIKVNNFF